uniref:C2H2-type domain-containing protein n=1 Tax=Mola mola TaxID=94237 RepID=A0A3Q3WDK5_MOLML
EPRTILVRRLNVFSRIPSLHLMRSMSPWQPQVTPPAVCSSLTTSQMPRRSGPACSLAAEGPAEAPPTAASEENGAVDPSTLETSPQVKNNVGDKTQGEMRQLKGQEAARAGVRPFLCDTCGKGFTAKSVLLEHQSIHSGEKHFTCATCGRSFRTSAHLLSHERVHSEERPFGCSRCGKTFKLKRALAQHQVVHTQEKPFVCPACGIAFGLKSNLRRHLRLHHGAQKPFTCPLCEKTFYFKSKLREHQAAAHRDQMVTCCVCHVKELVHVTDGHALGG